MARRILGLDIGERSLAAVVLTHRHGGYRIEGHARAAVAASGSEGTRLPEALRAVLGQIDPRGCTCAVSIPPGLASFRNLQIPFNRPHKIRQVLPFELEPALPRPVEDLCIGFHSLASGNADAAASTGLVAAAVPKERLKHFLDVLAEVKIHPETVTLGGYAAARWAASRSNRSDALLLNIDGRHCAVFALSAGDVISVRAFSTGDASTVDKLCAGVVQTSRAFEETLPQVFRPQRAIVVGAWSAEQDSNVTAALAERLQLPAEQADFTRYATGAEGQWEPAAMDNALALALAETDGREGINFRPGPMGWTKLWTENRASVLRTAALAATMLLLALAGTILDSSAMKRRLEGLNRQISAIFQGTFPEVRTVVDPLQQMRVKVQEARRAAGLTGDPRERMRVVDILREISLRVPASIEVDLDQAVIGPEGVRISGTTNGFDAVDRIKNSLVAAPGFTSVSIASATVEKSSGRIQFKLNLAL